MARFWQRMNTVADVVLALVRTLRMRDIREDQAFLAGIFHDCGVALLAGHSREYAKTFMGGAEWPNLPALDAQTRLMAGKYLEYRVTEKS